MSSESDISIIARDEASRALMAVADSVQQLNARIFELSNASQTLQTTQAAASGFFSTLQVAAGAAVAYLGTAKLFEFANKATEAYNRQNKAASGLGDAHVKMAADMQQALGVGDEVTLGIIKQAQVLGVSQDKLQDVAKAAVGLSEATGVGLNEALKKVNAAINGNAGALQDYLPELRSMSSEEEKLAAVTQLAEAGLAKKAGAMQRLDGVMLAASNSVGDLWEKIGTLLEPAVRLTYTAIGAMADVANAALVPAIQAMGSMTEWWASATETATQFVVGAVTAVEVAFTNMGKVVEIGLLTGYLAAVKFANDVEYLLTDQIPAYATWFAENWVNIFRDLGVATVTIFNNMGRNIGEAAFALFDWISSGFSGGFEGLSERLSNAIFVGIMDGFEAKTASLPDIIGRQITGEEQALANRIGELGNSLGTAFNSKFKARMDAIQLDKSKFDMTLDLSTTGKAAADKSAGELKAIESRLLTRGRADDPIDKVADNTQQTVAELRKLNQRGGMNKPDKSPIVLKVNNA